MVFVNGSVGVEKPTVVDALGESEVEEGVPHAVIDLDQIRRCWPAPENDPFQLGVELRNLAATVGNYGDAGAEQIVVEELGVVERYREANQARGMLLCRLVIDPRLAERRLQARHVGDPEGLEWHSRRHREPADILAGAGFEELVLNVGTRTPRELAAEIRIAAGWSQEQRQQGLRGTGRVHGIAVTGE
ncbi:hypothetical protein D5S18_17395 [Nocardia panacis]|uniref:Adenylyl-sulfate kinase n=1 Tax=Nocardia panacis TaxID=2340916 RepID=A0A3A4K4C1_9NOCA|nr:hypothetical protein D5S18_17395 [Nocardia panacis]